MKSSVGIIKIAREIKEGKLDINNIDEDVISSHLDTYGIPDPDLMIRTSGEQRLSNYFYGSLRMQNFILLMYSGQILIKKNLKRL